MDFWVKASARECLCYRGFIGFCDVLVERPELQDGFPFVNVMGRPRDG